ncbi:MAG: UbiA family prenyltransferase [Candidatus Marsarchaeota archaeon]|nr:UbiA family prenyltransferase [Candidatus Marsarchaeota archaeon]MCL5094929.1 UbiA family prenyltransferase [Candidatus Marsarchaeota archaeon]
MTLANTIKQILKLTRIEHSLILVIAVISGEIIVLKNLPNFYLLILSLITPIFISMSAFAINDYFDIKTDRENKKNRPIVIGAIKKETALFIALICLFIGVFSALFINKNAFIIAIIFGLISVLYSYKLKDIFLIGNIFIGLSMAIPFIFGNYVVSNTISLNIIFISALILFAGIGREIHGMIRDYKGDIKIRKTKNIVKYFGMKNSAILAFFLYLIAIFISFYLFLFNLPFKFNIFYLIPILIADLMLLFINTIYLKIIMLKRNEMNKNTANINKFYDMSRNLSLIAMTIALIGFIISSMV